MNILIFDGIVKDTPEGIVDKIKLQAMGGHILVDVVKYPYNTTLVFLLPAKPEDPEMHSKPFANISIRKVKDDYRLCIACDSREIETLPYPTVEMMRDFAWGLLAAIEGVDYADNWRKGLTKPQPTEPPTMQEQASAPSEPTANQVEEEQTRTKPGKELERKRIFGLRVDYLIAAILLDIFICIASLFLFPDWARSIVTLVILLSVGFGAATSFIANFRKSNE